MVDTVAGGIRAVASARWRPIIVALAAVLLTATASLAVTPASAEPIKPPTPEPSPEVPSCEIVERPNRQHHTICPNADMTRQHLDGIDLSYAELAGARFGRVLHGTNFYRADLSWAIMNEVTFDDVNLTGTNMDSAQLNEAVMTGTTTFGRGRDPANHANVSNTQLVPRSPVWLNGEVTWDRLRAETTQINGTRFGRCIWRSSQDPDRWALVAVPMPTRDLYYTRCTVYGLNRSWAWGDFTIHMIR
jgi:hypothetical protein